MCMVTFRNIFGSCCELIAVLRQVLHLGDCPPDPKPQGKQVSIPILHKLAVVKFFNLQAYTSRFNNTIEHFKDTPMRCCKSQVTRWCKRAKIAKWFEAEPFLTEADHEVPIRVKEQIRDIEGLQVGKGKHTLPADIEMLLELSLMSAAHGANSLLPRPTRLSQAKVAETLVDIVELYNKQLVDDNKRRKETNAKTKYMLENNEISVAEARNLHRPLQRLACGS